MSTRKESREQNTWEKLSTPMARLVTALLSARELFQEGLSSCLESAIKNYQFEIIFLNWFYYMFPVKGSKQQRLSQSLEVTARISTFHTLALIFLFPLISGLHTREAISRKPANLTTERNNS